MLDLSSGLPYFWIRNGLPFDYPALEHAARCEVLIVGGGITGALCAHALAEAGLEVVVVDRRTIGTGSTAASTALLQYEIDVPLHELSEQVGERNAARAYLLGVEAVEGLRALCRELGVDAGGRCRSLQFASKRSHESGLRKEQRMRSELGIACEMLEREEVARFIPGIRACGLMSHTAAATDPYALTHALFQAVQRRGGAVYDRTAIRNIEKEGSAYLVRTDRGHLVRARHVVMCTGYESQAHLSEPVMKLHSTYAIAGERKHDGGAWDADLLIWETARPYLYMRGTSNGRVLIGGLDEPFVDASRRDRQLQRKATRLERRFHQLFPTVPFSGEYAWCGTFGTTQDGLPYLDQDPGSGLWYVLGMGGNGITFSWIGARIVRDGLLGRRNADRLIFRFGR